MNYIIAILLLLPCCVKAQTDTTKSMSNDEVNRQYRLLLDVWNSKAAYNKDSTVWLTTTDPRITLEYISTHKVKHHKLHLWPVHRKRKHLILCGAFTKMEPYKQ